METDIKLHKGKKYIISNDDIEVGDFIYNKPSNSIDKCIGVFTDDLVAEFNNGMRAVFSKKTYFKLIEFKPNNL